MSLAASDVEASHPKHYNEHPAGIECITVVEAFSFNLGNVIKYVWRAGLKTTSPIEDLKKARDYLGFEIARLEREADAAAEKGKREVQW